MKKTNDTKVRLSVPDTINDVSLGTKTRIIPQVDIFLSDEQFCIYFAKLVKRYQSNSFYRNIWEICVWLNTIAWTGYGDDVIGHNFPDSEKSSASNEFPTDYDKKELSQYPLPVFSKKIQNCSSLKKISTSDWEPKHIRSLPSYLHVSLFWILRKTS